MIKQAREAGSMEGCGSRGAGEKQVDSGANMGVLCRKMEPTGFAGGLRKTKASRMTPSFWPEHLASQSCPLL